MAFIPRTFEQILDEMVAYVQANTLISDFTVGSVIRTLLEAAALEDDEQYFQMVQLLDSFAFTTASGEDLDRRLADFGIAREGPKSSFGTVQFFDTNLTTEIVSSDAPAGAFDLFLFDTAIFPSAFPYSIRIGESTARVQTASVTANDLDTDTLTVSVALVHDVFVGDRVSLITGATSRVIVTGTNLQAPQTVSESARVYNTREPATITAGNFFSNEVLAVSATSGDAGNVGVGRVTRFLGAPPFSGGGVTNVTPMQGGSIRESDTDFRARAVEQLQSLSRGTRLALKAASVGVEDPATGQRVASSSIVEDFIADEVIVYIDDGSGLDPDVSIFPRSSLVGTVAVGGPTVELSNTSSFPSFGTILIEADITYDAELIEYVSNDTGTNILTLAAPLTIAHGASTTIVNLVDVVSASAEIGQSRFSLKHIAIVRNSERIFIKPPIGTWALQVRDVDYSLNKGTGEFKFMTGLGTGTSVVAQYSFYTNLIARVQRTLEGDLDDSITFPGVKAAGIFLSVEAPTLKRITVRASITAEDTFLESDLADSIQSAIESYIASRKVGQDIIRTRMIDAAFNVTGLRDIIILEPTTNVTVLEDELPVAFDSSGDPLIFIV